MAKNLPCGCGGLWLHAAKPSDTIIKKKVCFMVQYSKEKSLKSLGFKALYVDKINNLIKN